MNQINELNDSRKRLISTMDNLEQTESHVAGTHQVCHIDLSANWNKGHSRTVEYRAPQGYTIVSAEPVILSKRGRSNYSIDRNPRKVTLTASARGSGKAWDQKRGWIKMYVNVTLASNR